MAGIEPDRPLTKSGLTREIASIDTHYNANVLTKAGDPMPDAYILNFANDEGFAVLGANTSVAPIVAITENGAIDAETLYVDGYVPEEKGHEENAPSTGEFIGTICQKLEQDRFIRDAIGGGLFTGVVTTTKNYATVSSILKTKWNQGEYGKPSTCNQYCIYNGVHVLAGCATIAIAQTIASLPFMGSYYYHAFKIDNNVIKNPSAVGYNQQVGWLIGFVFENISKNSIRTDGTGIKDIAVKKFLTSYAHGFYSVGRSYDSCYSNDFVQTTSDYLKSGKPVIVGGYPGGRLNRSDGHYWVIDGAKFARYNNVNTYLVHCNWGWGGKYDGYFSTNCLYPEDQQALHDNYVKYDNDTEEYTHGFVIFTYDFHK